ncbi:MAG: PfkB family carbohydrate kinase [Sphaerochaetaceae bacterium]|jgi:sugar/nucleoside kinase (ribokinase family)
MKYDIVMIGHISKDILIDHTNLERRLLGGAVVYSSASAAASGARVQVITKLNKQDIPLIKEVAHPSITWDVLPSKQSTAIQNRYFTADKEKREVTLLSQADPFTLEDIHTDATVYHLAGLFGGEIPDTLITPLSERGLVGMDSQGVLRCLDEDNNLVFKDWPRKKELLPLLTYFKVDAAEAFILTGIEDRKESAQVLNSWGAQEVMLTHNSEVMICSNNTIYTAPYTNTNNSGRTGRGDTTFAAYMAWRQNHSIEESVAYAAALCSIKMESPGVFTGSVEEVLQRVTNQ